MYNYVKMFNGNPYIPFFMHKYIEGDDYMSIKIVETSLRDGHQSLLATRMTTKEILEIIPDLDKAGFHALEVWGGATFDACLRFLNEDPWERLREIKKSVGA